jgi:hypothetical protein
MDGPQTPVQPDFGGLTCLTGVGTAQLWQLTPEQLTQFTAKNPFERFLAGRPKVPDALLEKLRTMDIGIEDKVAGGTLRHRRSGAAFSPFDSKHGCLWYRNTFGARSRSLTVTQSFMSIAECVASTDEQGRLTAGRYDC